MDSTPVGFCFKIGDRCFFARELPFAIASGNGPAIVIHPSKTISRDFVSTLIDNWERNDDVFEKAFLRNIFLARSHDAPSTVDSTTTALFSPWSPSVVATISSEKDVPPGPYYIAHGFLHAVWRAFPDHQEAFIEATVARHDGSGGHDPFLCSDGRRVTIAAPSRLYFTPTEQKPLQGLRMSVKDNIDIAGVKTALASRAWEELYPAKETTAPALDRLLDLGAIVVGKSKLSQFAEVETPTADWVDVHGPFNTRGDGYLNPEGSTSGGAAALAAYGWLDVSVGTDTGGSLREPSAKQGLFGIRTTYGALPLDGVFPLARALDTLGFMCRDAGILDRVVSHWLPGPTVDVGKNVKTIIVVTDFLYPPGPAHEVFQSFLADLEEAIGVRITLKSLNDEWIKDNPAKDGKTLLEYIGKQQTMKTIKNFDLWRNTEPFRKEYRAATGREPYVNSSIRARWIEAEKVTAEEQGQALERKKTFEDWFLRFFLGWNSSRGLDTVMVNPLSDADPEYRDDYTDGPWMGGSGFHRNFVSSLTGCPEVMVPIGQIPYESRVSKRQEYLPVVAVLLGPPGMDAALSKLTVESLQKVGLPTSVKPGSLAFPT